ncbi:hypothetical protein HR060_16285 [Catenovulum sp. SM1970]|uniref:spondin domain-containing protein n=1 Tax=Marinifaba aquimaris TaxID=2741323 RepID=UPI00157275EF|nr:spondin domain-containing protein [Marinifaba aquimaris]NTS78408.1 hypothetical protein [Marinifaba aquimaris]
MRNLYKPIIPTLATALFLVGCDGDSNNELNLNTANVEMATPVPAQYQITAINLTHAQPLSPIAILLHNEGQIWQIGQPASNALEQLAEGGQNQAVLDLASVNVSTEGILMPGMSTSISITADASDPKLLTISSMLVNTNDAFVGLNAMSLADLAVGDSITMSANVYDAGTEANSEASGTIPGPADGGEGYLPERDDVDFVAMHAGVVGVDGGLSTSVLSSVHKFDNPSVRFIVSRIE